jgi:hypothetical protein
VRCVRDFGRVIVYGAATGEIPQLDTRLLYAKGASVHGLWLSYLSANRPLMEAAWKQLSEWLAGGKLHPVIGKVFPLEQAREAYTLMQEGKNYGKIVLKINSRLPAGSVIKLIDLSSQATGVPSAPAFGAMGGGPRDLQFFNIVWTPDKTLLPCYSSNIHHSSANAPSARASNTHVRGKHGSQRRKKSGAYLRRDAVSCSEAAWGVRNESRTT